MARGKDNNTSFNDLGYLGSDFQKKLVKVFMEVPNFFGRICDMVDQNMFTEDMLRRIVGYMKDRYKECGNTPTYDELDMLCKIKCSDSITLDILLSTIEELKAMDLRGQDIIMEHADKFFKQQNLTKAINKAQDIVKNGNFERYYEIENMIEKALNTNMFSDTGYNPMDNIEGTLSEKARPTLPTGFPRLDKCLFGGLGRGELGVVIAPSNVGKTSAMTGFAASAATYCCDANNHKGFNVMHIHFEDDDYNIKRKYIGWLTGIDAMNLTANRPQVLDILNTSHKKWHDLIKENIQCYHLVSGETTVNQIEQLIRRKIAEGKKPDLLIIDYFECLKMERGERTDSEWTREGQTMRKLEALAHRYNLALWVPIQGSKDSFDKDILGLSSGGGSVKKVQIGHIVITMARTHEQKVAGRLTLSVEKLRAGAMEDATMANIKFNGGTGRFSCDEDATNAMDYIAAQPAQQTGSGRYNVNQTVPQR